MPEPHGYHHAVVLDQPLVLTSGQTWQSRATLATDPQPDLAEETRMAVANAITALAGGGSGAASLASLDLFVVDLRPDDLAQVYRGMGRAARDLGFGAVATTILGVSALAVPDARVEVKATGAATNGAAR
ncbi:Rid family hydrolase [Nocardioides sp. AE5]|uniref:Rid family hydrolase n=1 Tax=Nocardioides sp. AE5 TaxID=2962573 RepID=UPI0028815122|nr:Rid family hydrolase [Nocardioides sp. AE5]MDT0202732.1 Rid family hydrolase [Nocardioides sp. AE5]